MNENCNKETIIGIPASNDIPLLGPYSELTIKKECKICCKDLLNLLIPMICIVGSISATIIIIGQCIK